MVIIAQNFVEVLFMHRMSFIWSIEERFEVLLKIICRHFSQSIKFDKFKGFNSKYCTCLFSSVRDDQGG